MPMQRTELRDDLTALIAAGRELSPDHDRVLAEVFIDHLTSRGVPPSRTRRSLAIVRKPRRLLAAAILALGLLGVASVQPFNQGGSSSIVVQVQPANGKCVGTKLHPACAPVLKSVPVGKVPAIPLAPKAPAAPRAPVPKSGS